MSKENEDTDLVDYEPLIDHAIRTGFFADVPNAVYQSHPAISRSMIAQFADCEKYLQHELATREVWETQDEDPSKAQKLGTAVHEYIFEPQVAKERYKVAPDQCEATKSDGERCSYSPSGYYTDEDADGAGADDGQFLCGTHSRGREPDDAVEVLPIGEASRIEGMYEALFNDEEAKRLLWDLPGRSELSLVWRHESGLPLRARLDRLVCEEPSGDGEPTDPRERWGIVDLKTCRSAHPKDVQRQLGKGYWLQPVIYAMGVRELTGVWPSFRFVFVESQPPHVVQTYAMDSVQLDQIRERAEQYCWDIAAAIETEDFAGYTTDDVAVTAMKRWDLERYGMQP
jgi:hypothetical protein